MHLLDDIILLLKSKYKLNDLVSGPDHVYKIQINRKFILSLCQAESENAFFLYAELCPLPADEKERIKLYEQLLQGNLFGHETHQAYFATDNNHGVVLLIQKFKENTHEIDHFEEELKDFINVLNYWDQKLQNGEQQPSNLEQNLALKYKMI